MEENTIWKDMVQEDIEEDKNIDKKDRIKKIICVILGICIGALLTGVYVSQRAMEVDARISKMQGNLSKEVFRFHVLADSDSDEAQPGEQSRPEEVLRQEKEAGGTASRLYQPGIEPLSQHRKAQDSLYGKASGDTGKGE